MSIRVSVIGGAGSWGQHYVNAVVQHPGCSLVGFVDPCTERRDDLAGYYSIDRRFLFEDLSQQLDRTTPDIACIAVPTARNPEIVLACLEAGVRVLSCEKPAAVSLAESDRIVEASTHAGAIIGVGSLIANHVLRDAERWIAGGGLGTIKQISLPGGLGAHVSGDGAQRLSPIRVLSGSELRWAEGWETEDLYSGKVDDATEVEIDGPVHGRLGLSGEIEVHISPVGEAKGSWVVIEGDDGRVEWSPQGTRLLQRADMSNVTDLVVDKPAPQLRYSFVPLVDSLVRAYEEGERLRPDPEDMRFALEAAVGLKQSHHSDHARVSLPNSDRSSKIWPHPYRSYGGDVAGFQSLWPKYESPSLENHLRNLYIKKAES
jgi:predicted dehydrogenase